MGSRKFTKCGHATSRNSSKGRRQTGSWRGLGSPDLFVHAHRVLHSKAHCGGQYFTRWLLRGNCALLEQSQLHMCPSAEFRSIRSTRLWDQTYFSSYNFRRAFPSALPAHQNFILAAHSSHRAEQIQLRHLVRTSTRIIEVTGAYLT